MRIKNVIFSVFSGVSLFIISCTTTKNTTYFQNVSDSLLRTSQPLASSQYTDPLIKPNDILQISVQTIDPQSTNSMGTQSTSTHSVQGSPAESTGGGALQGYMVDKNGNVELPLVGKIKVGGLSTEAAREAIKQKVTIFYKDPVVNVRLVNFYVTVLGEVNRPSKYIIPNEKANLLDAIALAGDLTISGKRENVMLIRDENGEKKATRFDLRSSAIYESPYFYLRQGDVIYVEANKAKIAANDVRTIRNISIMTSLVSLIIVAISQIRF